MAALLLEVSIISITEHDPFQVLGLLAISVMWRLNGSKSYRRLPPAATWATERTRLINNNNNRRNAGYKSMEQNA
jgi:hypothetical protein